MELPFNQGDGLELIHIANGFFINELCNDLFPHEYDEEWFCASWDKVSEVVITIRSGSITVEAKYKDGTV